CQTGAISHSHLSVRQRIGGNRERCGRNRQRKGNALRLCRCFGVFYLKRQGEVVRGRRRRSHDGASGGIQHQPIRQRAVRQCPVEWQRPARGGQAGVIGSSHLARRKERDGYLQRRNLVVSRSATAAQEKTAQQNRSTKGKRAKEFVHCRKPGLRLVSRLVLDLA